MSKESALGMIPTPQATPPPQLSTESTVSTGEVSPAQPLESTRLSALMKKEAEFVKEREAFKKEREAYISEKEKMKSIQDNLAKFEDMKVKDPLGALKLLGFSEADLMNFAAQDKQRSPEEIVKSELDKYKDEQAKKEQEALAQRNEQVLAQFKTDINKAIVADHDKYEFISYNGPAGEELIYETVQSVLQDSGELITIQEAADMVESYYEEMYKNMSGLKKVKPKEEPKVETKEEPKKDEPLKAQVSPRPSPAKTLTSKETATSASTTIYKKESSDEKKQRLIKKYLYS